MDTPNAQKDYRFRARDKYGAETIGLPCELCDDWSRNAPRLSNVRIPQIPAWESYLNPIETLPKKNPAG